MKGGMNPESWPDTHTDHWAVPVEKRGGSSRNVIRKPEQSTSTEEEKANRGTVKLKVKWGIRQKDREGHGERELPGWGPVSWVWLRLSHDWLDLCPPAPSGTFHQRPYSRQTRFNMDFSPGWSWLDSGGWDTVEAGMRWKSCHLESEVCQDTNGWGTWTKESPSSFGM